MKKIDVKFVCYMAIVAALYVALTYAFTPLSYGAIQFRISEILVLLVLYKKEYAIPLILGCLVANLMSPLGALDIALGTLATAISVGIMIFIKNKYVASLIPAIVNGLIIGLELYMVWELPFWLSAAQVFIGEFVVISIIGIAVFKGLENNFGMRKILYLETFTNKEIVRTKSMYSNLIFASVSLIVLLYFYLPIYSVTTGMGDDAQIVYTMLSNLTFDKSLSGQSYWYLLILVLPIINLITAVFAPKLINLLVSAGVFIAIFILMVVVLVATVSSLGFSILFFMAFIMIYILNFMKFKSK